MKTDLLRSFAFALGLSVASGLAHGTYADEYQSPAKWDSFQAPRGSISEARRRQLHPAAQEPVTPVSARQSEAVGGYPITEAGPVSDPEIVNQLAPPAARQPEMELPIADGYTAQPEGVLPEPVARDSASGQSSQASAYASAAAAPWEADAAVGVTGGSAAEMPIAPPTLDQVGSCQPSCGHCAPAVRPSPGPISPWFGGANLLFWNLEDGKDRPLITDDTAYPYVRFSDLDPDSDVGFDAHIGRYFGCGQYGIDFGYMFWDPDAVWQDVVDTGSGLRFTHPALRDVSINRGGGATTIYDEYDTNATQIRVRRDVAIQGVEVNLVSFGLMGARRLGRCAPTPVLRHHGRSHGFFGGATGPLARACSGRLRTRTTHGFRWFRFEDSLEIIGDVDGTTGYQGSDLYYLNDVENNLYGYQFGSALTYCVGCNLFFNIGGKFGVYGNDVQNRHRITTETVVAYTNSQGGGAGDLCCEDDDVVLSGLGELDLGVGYRIGRRLSFSGGYRVLAVSGIATAIGQIPNEYTTNVSATRVHANESVVLHGAYVGFDYNW